LYFSLKAIGDAQSSQLPQNTNWAADGTDILLIALAIERRHRR
jgi:hypothetical protein